MNIWFSQGTLSTTNEGDFGIIVEHNNDADQTQYEHSRAQERAAIYERVTERLWPTTRVYADKCRQPVVEKGRSIVFGLSDNVVVAAQIKYSSDPFRRPCLFRKVKIVLPF